MPHPLVLGLFENADAAMGGARAAHEAGVSREELSVVARDHRQDVELARKMDGTPGVELEDSATMFRVGEFSGHVLAALAFVLPGVGPIVAGGPLGAALGEAAGHVAGGISSVLQTAGIEEKHAARWESQVEAGAVLLGIHVLNTSTAAARTALERAGAIEVVVAEWEWS
jgi:hypothetical protein